MTNPFLSEDQIPRAIRVGTARHNAPKKGDRGGAKSKTKEEQLADDIEGAAAECWFAENYLGERWQETSRVRAVDHTDKRGIAHEIKQSLIDCATLIVRDETPRNHIHHQIVGSIETGFRHAGWLDGIDIPKASLRGFSDPDGHGGRGDCYQVTQNRLYQPRADNDDANMDNAEVVLKALRRVGRENLGCRPGLVLAARLYKSEIDALVALEEIK